jgi:fructosamine-3-kinase
MTKRWQNDDESQALWPAVGRAIGQHTGKEEKLEPLAAVSGGDINRAMRVRHGDTDYFVKLNRAERLGMFQAEAAGLQAIARAGTLRCPFPVACGSVGDSAYLVLEHLDLGGHGRSSALGEGLAELHRTTAPRYGWHLDNTIGTTPQPNGWNDEWVPFLRNRRLGPQLELAARNGLNGKEYGHGQALLDRLEFFFRDYAPVSSLLHGDLWGGNYGYLVSGEAVIFDPAVYFGDRESDLAMTELFGGFDSGFYAAYQANWPLDAGYPVRRKIYQLYHVLNHFNLFAGGYGAQAGRMIRELLAELG